MADARSCLTDSPCLPNSDTNPVRFCLSLAACCSMRPNRSEMFKSCFKIGSCIAGCSEEFVELEAELLEDSPTKT